MSPINIDITARGDITEHAKTQAREKIGALERYVHAPILGARVVLSLERNPRIAQPARVEGEIDLQGKVIRAHADGQTVEAAIDEVAERLHRQLRAYVDKLVTIKRDRSEAAKAQARTEGAQS
jgi:ribosomal subunit interface protein